MLSLILQPGQKFGLILVNKGAQQLKLPKNYSVKKFAPINFFIEKDFQKDFDNF